MLNSKAKHALIWITDILQKQNISFQITGGLAAKIYGVARELSDIDIDIPEDQLVRIETEVKKYITFGPAHLTTDLWDLWLMTLNYEGQEIDLGGSQKTKIFDRAKNAWHEIPTDFAKSNWIEIFDRKLPFISREELISYKSILARDVDLLDIQQIMKK